MALYFAEGGNGDKVLGLTYHHALFKTDGANNDDYAFPGAGAPPTYVQLLGTRAFDKLLGSIKMRIGRHSIMVGIHSIMVGIYEGQIKRLEARVGGDEEEDVAEAKKELKKTGLLDDANEAVEDLEKFYEKVKEWASPSSAPSATSTPPQPSPSTSVPKALPRIRARSSSTALSSRSSRAISSILVRFDLSRSRSSSLTVALSTEIPSDQFTLKMYPRNDGKTTFQYPDDRLLPLRKMITEERMREPDMLDHGNETCLLVIKNGNGNATDVTIGCATGNLLVRS